MSVKDRFRQIRLSTGLKQDEFGDKLGLGRGVTSGIERGVQGVALQTQEKLIQEMNVSIDWLLTGRGKMFQSKGTNDLEGSFHMIYHVIEGLDKDCRELRECMNSLEQENAELRQRLERLETGGNR